MIDHSGEYLLKTGSLKESQVEEVRRMQKNGDTRVLGIIAMKLGYITEENIRQYVEHLERELNRLQCGLPLLPSVS